MEHSSTNLFTMVRYSNQPLKKVYLTSGRQPSDFGQKKPKHSFQ